MYLLFSCKNKYSDLKELYLEYIFKTKGIKRHANVSLK